MTAIARAATARDGWLSAFLVFFLAGSVSLVCLAPPALNRFSADRSVCGSFNG
jgi:hypothetical protein